MNETEKNWIVFLDYLQSKEEHQKIVKVLNPVYEDGTFERYGLLKSSYKLVQQGMVDGLYKWIYDLQIIRFFGLDPFEYINNKIDLHHLLRFFLGYFYIYKIGSYDFNRYNFIRFAIDEIDINFLFSIQEYNKKNVYNMVPKSANTLGWNIEIYKTEYKDLLK